MDSLMRPALSAMPRSSRAWKDRRLPYRQRLLPIKVLFVAALLSLSGVGEAAETPRLLILGDSIAAGYGLSPEDAFPARLGQALRARKLDATILDGSVSGDTTAGGLARAGWALADRPTHVIIELGGNDALRGIDPVTTRDNLDQLISRFKKAGVKILLAGMLAPPNWGQAYETRFNHLYPELRQKHDIDLYPFILDGVATEPELNQPDGIHPNADGVLVIVDRIMPYVVRLLGEQD